MLVDIIIYAKCFSFLCSGRNSNRGENLSQNAGGDSGLPSKYHNMIYRAYHSADRTGGRLSPLEDDFKASNKEEEFFSSPPEKEWLPVNRPSGSRTW